MEVVAAGRRLACGLGGAAMTKPDFETAAAKIIAVVYRRPDARQLIAEILHLTWLQGRGAGIEDARQIYIDFFATLPTTEKTR